MMMMKLTVMKTMYKPNSRRSTTAPIMCHSCEVLVPWKCLSIWRRMAISSLLSFFNSSRAGSVCFIVSPLLGTLLSSLAEVLVMLEVIVDSVKNKHEACWTVIEVKYYSSYKTSAEKIRSKLYLDSIILLFAVVCSSTVILVQNASKYCAEENNKHTLYL